MRPTTGWSSRFHVRSRLRSSARPFTVRSSSRRRTSPGSRESRVPRTSERCATRRRTCRGRRSAECWTTACGGRSRPWTVCANAPLTWIRDHTGGSPSCSHFLRSASRASIPEDNAERNLLDVFAAAALPLPQQQVEVRPSNRTYYLDYAWKDVKVFAEWYGLPWHVGTSAVTHDNARLTDLFRPRAGGPSSSPTSPANAEIVTKTRQLLVDVGLIDR